MKVGFPASLCIWISNGNALLLANNEGNSGSFVAISGAAEMTQRGVSFTGLRTKISSFGLLSDAAGHEHELVVYDLVAHCLHYYKITLK